MRLGRLRERYKRLEHKLAVVNHVLSYVDMLIGDSRDNVAKMINACHDAEAAEAGAHDVRKRLLQLRNEISEEISEMDSFTTTFRRIKEG